MISVERPRAMPKCGAEAPMIFTAALDQNVKAALPLLMWLVSG
jgi:hypothetical protein